MAVKSSLSCSLFLERNHASTLLQNVLPPPYTLIVGEFIRRRDSGPSMISAAEFLNELSEFRRSFLEWPPDNDSDNVSKCPITC